VASSLPNNSCDRYRLAVLFGGIACALRRRHVVLTSGDKRNVKRPEMKRRFVGDRNVGLALARRPQLVLGRIGADTKTLTR
jgi:hypothetical protein